MQLPYPAFQLAASLLGLVPDGWRFGKSYHVNRNLFVEAANWDVETIRLWQLRRLQRLLKHAQERIPFYRHSFAAAGLDWQDIKCLDDFKRIPMLTKQEISHQPEAFLAEGSKNQRLTLAVTGGSTGAPLGFFLQKDHTAIEAAFLSSILARFGCAIGDRFAFLRTQRRGRNPKTPYWTLNPHRSQLVISSYLISEESVVDMADAISDFKPAYILAIPSTASLFCHYLRKKGKSILPSSRVVILGSENSYPEQKRMISDTFGAPTIMHYGQCESVVMAEEDCPDGHYHVNPFYGFAEVLDPYGRQRHLRGESGEIVGTGFHNFAMPLIRYRTGDIATIGEGISRWGLKGDLWQRIEGRTTELVTTRDGRWIMLAALMFGTHDSTLANVLQLQVEQDKPGLLLLRIVKKSDYGPDDETKIHRMIENLSNGGFDVAFEYVEVIARLASGKHRFLIQHLQQPEETSSEKPPTF